MLFFSMHFVLYYSIATTIINDSCSTVLFQLLLELVKLAILLFLLMWKSCKTKKIHMLVIGQYQITLMMFINQPTTKSAQRSVHPCCLERLCKPKF